MLPHKNIRVTMGINIHTWTKIVMKITISITDCIGCDIRGENSVFSVTCSTCQFFVIVSIKKTNNVFKKLHYLHVLIISTHNRISQCYMYTVICLHSHIIIQQYSYRKNYLLIFLLTHCTFNICIIGIYEEKKRSNLLYIHSITESECEKKDFSRPLTTDQLSFIYLKM